MGLQPHIATYTAESIINWHVHVLNGRRQLGMLVLKETAAVHYDEFTWDYVDRFRVLVLTIASVYAAALRRKRRCNNRRDHCARGVRSTV
jgi:hypothetical protein